MTESLETLSKYIVFQLKDKEYAIPVSQVKGIEKVGHITRVPKTKSFVKGVINLRGVITPIIDLRTRFAFENEVFDESTRVIIVSFKDLEVGFIVDAANDVLDVEASLIEPTPEVVGVEEAEFINGVAKVGKRLLILIDLEKVLERIEK